MSWSLFLLVLVHQVSENSGHYVSVLGFHFFLGHGILFRKANCDMCDKKNVTHVTLLFRNYFFYCIFSKNLVHWCWHVFLKANNVLPFWSFCGKYYFAYCDGNCQNCYFLFIVTHAFSTHSCWTTAGLNVKMVIQKIGKDPEQSLVGCFDEFKIRNGILRYWKGKIYCQYCDTCDMEWPISVLWCMNFWLFPPECRTDIFSF